MYILRTLNVILQQFHLRCPEFRLFAETTQWELLIVSLKPIVSLKIIEHNRLWLGDLFELLKNSVALLVCESSRTF